MNDRAQNTPPDGDFVKIVGELFRIPRKIPHRLSPGRADYTPVFLSKVPELFHRRLIPIDVALVQTSPPDEHVCRALTATVFYT
jgi:acyl-CoA hydrolase